MKTSTHTFDFAPEAGAMAEYQVLVTVTDPALDFKGQLESVLRAYREASAGRTVHFRRFFLSDAANQAPALAKSLADLPQVPTSIVQQAPLDGTRIALWVYATSPMERKGGAPVHNGYSHHWAGSLVAPGQDAREQMYGIFRGLDAQLGRKKLSVAADTVRTWIFVRDVDANYAGVVAGRKAWFDSIGLTADTHYIASTGIQGQHPDLRCIVEMDAYSVGGLREGQVAFLQARNHLNPTYDYGVTFERGTAVTYGDRRHVFISGTASIDPKGNVLHAGDAVAQTRRILENVGALLDEAQAGLKDISMAVVYLRDPADAPAVRRHIESACPQACLLMVHAPVCRPAWLVEMECIAVTADGDKSFPVF